MPEVPVRTLALDVGDRRIGLALSAGSLALPLFTFHRSTLRADLKSLARLVRKHAVTDLVLGLPLHANGSESPQSSKTRAFAEALRSHLEPAHPALRLHLIDERHTTGEAHTLLDRSRGAARSKAGREQRTAVIDQVAAVLLLEAFLSMQNPPLLPDPNDL